VCSGHPFVPRPARLKTAPEPDTASVWHQTTIRTLRQPQFAAQVVDGLRPFATGKPRQPPITRPKPARLVGRAIRDKGQYRRIEGREKRERRQHVAGQGIPVTSATSGRHSSIRQQQQVGACGLGCGVQQVIVGLRSAGNKSRAAHARAMLNVVDHLHQNTVGGSMSGEWRGTPPSGAIFGW